MIKSTTLDNLKIIIRQIIAEINPDTKVIKN